MVVHFQNMWKCMNYMRKILLALLLNLRFENKVSEQCLVCDMVANFLFMRHTFWVLICYHILKKCLKLLKISYVNKMKVNIMKAGFCFFGSYHVVNRALCKCVICQVLYFYQFLNVWSWLIDLFKRKENYLCYTFLLWQVHLLSLADCHFKNNNLYREWMR